MPERGTSQNIPMTLEVHVEGLSPYEVEDQWMVSRKDTLGFGLGFRSRSIPTSRSGSRSTGGPLGRNVRAEGGA